MKNLNTNSKTQRGFFDFGLAIAIFAAGGTATYVRTSLEETENHAQQQEIQAQAEKDLSLMEFSQAETPSDDTD